MNVKKNKIKKKSLKRILRLLLKSFFILLLVFVLLVLFIRSPWGQNIVVEKVTNYVSEQIGTTFHIEKFYLSFNGNLVINEIYLEDQAQDTLIYSESLELNVAILPIFQQNKIRLKNLHWSGLVANINRNESKNFNYQYIIDAFANEENTAEENTTTYLFSIGSINLNNIQLSYKDAIEGQNASVQIEDLELIFEKFDLEELDFHLNEWKLSNSQIKYIQHKTEAKEQNGKLATQEEKLKDEASEQLPIFQLDRLIFDKVNLVYQDFNEKVQYQANLTDFQLNEAFANANSSEFKLKNIVLANSTIQLQLPEIQDEQVKKENSLENSFSWPNLQIEINGLAFTNNAINYQEGNQPTSKKGFNHKNIRIQDFNFNVSDFNFNKNEEARFQINKLNLTEASGFKLQQFAFNFQLNPNKLKIDALQLKTPKNNLAGKVNFTFKNLAQFIQDPSLFEKSNLNFNANLNLAEFIQIYPALGKIAYVDEAAKNPIQLGLKSQGNTQQLQLDKFQLNWASTELKASGNLNAFLNVDKLQYQLNKINFTTTKKDISKFIELEEQSFNSPEWLQLSGYANGSLQSFQTQSSLQIPEGEIKLSADFQQQDKIKLSIDLALVEMDLGSLFNQPNLAPVSWQLNANVEGKDWLALKGEVNSKFKKLNYADFDLSDLQFSGKLDYKNVEFNLGLDHKDIRFLAQSDIVLDSINPTANLQLDLQGANFKKLGITPRNIRAKTKFSAQFSGNTNQFEFKSKMDSTLVVHEQDAYHVPSIDLNVKVNQQETIFTSNSRFWQSNFQANAHPSVFVEALKTHLKSYYQKESTAELIGEQTKANTEDFVEIDADFQLYASPFITEVVAPGIQKLDTLSFKLSFQEKEQLLKTELHLPKLNYNEIELDSLAFNLNTSRNQADFNLGFQSLSSGVLDVAKTKFAGSFKDQKFQLDFEAYKDEIAFFDIHSDVNFTEDQIHFSIQPENLILNKVVWRIPEDNFIKINRDVNAKSIRINNFEITRNQQYIALKNNFEIEENHLGIDFKDFKLATFTSYLNTEKQFASGIISGVVIAVDPFQKIGFISDLKIENLSILENAIGNLNLNASSIVDETYQLQLYLIGEQVDFEASAKINQSLETPKYSLQANLTKLNLPLIEAFTTDYISDASGEISANFNLNSTETDLTYQGDLAFKDAALRVKSLNALFYLGDEQIDFNKEGIYFSNFKLNDIQKNAFVVDGKIETTSLSNPDFQLTAKADNFEALNSTKDDNDLYYGKVNFDADLQILGSLNFPKIEGELAFKETTDFTYIVRQVQAGTIEREGVVLFVNKKNPDDIVTQPNQERYNANITEVEVDVLLKINPATKAKIILNPKTGDYVQLQGGGDLKYKMARNGDMSLQGKYEVKNGQLELNFYNLVKRQFKIAEGSSVAWSGDLMNADIDIRAIYNIETSASSLMASQISAESSAVQNQYRQQLPFEVYLDVGGEINSPELNFKLDMPEANKAAINGTVYNRVLQINQQEDELNKHVFSLLVLNRFYPNSGSDGSQGGAASIARNNINQALSDQLNTYANKLTGNTGIQLNFDVNSYTDYQSGQGNNRTDVDVSVQKKLLNDRLIVEAGSQVNVEGDLRPGESNVALGNVSVQYLLTEDGRWKIKGFRKSEYENVIDGQVFISGIALIFNREFNRFKELWKTFIDNEVDENASEKDKKREEPKK